MKYSYFSSKNATRCHQVSVAELLERISTNDLKDKCAAIQAHILAGEEKEANELKNGLSCIVVSELYKEGTPRKAGTGEATGLVMIDYDNCKTEEELELLQSAITKLATSHPLLKDLIVAAHVSPRRHGVHVWFRWIEGCSSIEECQAKFAEMAQLPDYDKCAKDSSRCSFLVHKSMFFVQNWGAMERNEAFSALQKKAWNDGTKDSRKKGKQNGKSVKSNGAGRVGTDSIAGGAGSADSGDSSDKPVNEGLKTFPELFQGIKHSEIFKELTRLCAPAGMVDEEGNVQMGARNSTLMSVLRLFRYTCDNNPDWRESCLPEWALALEEEDEGVCRKMVERVCGFNVSPQLPPTLRKALAKLTKEKENEGLSDEELQIRYSKELEEIEEEKKKFFRIPQMLPPVFKEFAEAFPFEWRPGVLLCLLPPMGTDMSRIRARYLDGRLHSPSFQTVAEAKFGSGKGNITEMARFIVEPLTEADLVGNEKLNEYNAQVERANGSERLPEKPDVCVRKITGDFTVAGFEETLTTSKGLHIWCSTSEIDEVKKVWNAVSYILRKAYDNDFYGRSLQSTKTFRGERQVFFNTLLCGTTRAIDRCYSDPEDGLVSRTMFFKLMKYEEKMPIVKMSTKTREKLAEFVKKVHDAYSLGEDGMVVQAKVFDLDYVNKVMKKWLAEKYDESILTANPAIDSFRRRDAVNGFRAGMVAHVLFETKYGKVTEKHKEIVKSFALWVAEYSLQMHLLKFGKKINKIEAETFDDASEKTRMVLDMLPAQFSLAQAYSTFSHQTQASVRVILGRLTDAGYLIREERGFYSKTRKG
ncbi:MAG: hypothetical protein J6Y41_00120 [Bacteroidaceae bacterium]|nr:hypothetical protein [Bacteroidaceae bacterium]